jgi:predicted nucleic acid binding AN1-type Zn finger protein
MKCYLYDVEDLGFKCKYCKQFFCIEHHLPIHHACPDIDQYLEKRKRAISYNLPKNKVIGGITKL